MTNMELLKYAESAVIEKALQYRTIVAKYYGQRAGEIAEKQLKKLITDLDEIEGRIQDEKRKQMAKAEEEAKHREEQRRKQAIEEAPYVLVIKWNNPIMGEVEYPCQSYKEAEKNFETAKREVHNGNVIEAHVYEQGEGQRVPVMGILSGKL